MCVGVMNKKKRSLVSGGSLTCENFARFVFRFSSNFG